MAYAQGVPSADLSAHAPARPEAASSRVECETCGASLLVDPNQRTAVCPYCASPAVVERPPSHNRPAPHFAVGFSMSKESAQGAVKEWLGKRSFFVESSVKKGTIDSIRG